ncbi:hypothetical protein [Bacillus sp. T33-2]|uniref:hypothetical protein n=1 Tax=Bacillus sp. T33-2 TaxID=2054168 RepID=UPI000C771E69|nr:hypothetical protein [Bacillus sp. T33-2]PLR97497.1 hypothetical protein CVD19_08390 [Bacillus sp. T33-2]
MQNQNYRDFYQKALIPIGSNDQQSLDDSRLAQGLTHWLIALEGHAVKESDLYRWKVSVFQADCDGIFNANSPFYSSPLFDVFQDAYETSRDIESVIKNDQLYSVYVEEKIS